MNGKGGARRHTKKNSAKRIAVQRQTDKFAAEAQVVIDANAEKFQPKHK